MAEVREWRVLVRFEDERLYEVTARTPEEAESVAEGLAMDDHREREIISSIALESLSAEDEGYQYEIEFQEDFELDD